jgi:CRISPR system Cascade subunit CasA
MSPSERPSFDLVHDPWLRVRDLDGNADELGILRTLGTAHRLAGISGDIPTQTFALVRLLLAVLHGALGGPRDDDAWEELWAAERLPLELIADYLARHRSRFDLFHPETPFLQVADLHTASGGTSGMAALIADVPNGRPFFTTRLGPDLSLTYAEAARWLVHSHAFDISGIKSGAVGDDRVKGGKGYPIGVAWSGLLGGVLLEGKTLKETLLLNLVASDVRDPARDLPAWEREPVGPAEEQEGGRTPTGPVDLYTWQSRRIRLFPAHGRVRDALVANGERLTPQNLHGAEPHTAWRRSEAQEKKLSRPLVYMPREHDPERAVWRGLQSLLPRGTATQKGEASARLAPGVLQWLGHLSVEDMIVKDHVVRVRTIGMIYGSNNSVVDEVIDDALSMRALLARQDAEQLVGVATACVEAAELAARALGNLAANLAAAAGGDGAGPRTRALESAFAELDAPFRSWLLGIGADSDYTDVQIAWHHTAYGLIRGLAKDLQRRAPLNAWAGRQVRGRRLTPAHADKQFRDDLRKALPFAHTEQAASA